MARTFNGPDTQYLRNTSLSVSYPFSLSIWFYHSDTQNDQVMGVGSSTGGSDYYHNILLNYSNLEVIATSDDGSPCYAVSTGNYVHSAWNHAIAVFAASDDRRIYVNGGGKGTDATSVSISSDLVTIGARSSQDPSVYFTGRAAEAAVWGAELNDNDAASLGAGAHPFDVRPHDLIAYWPLLRTDQDLVGGYDMTAEPQLGTLPGWGNHPPQVAHPLPTFGYPIPVAAVGETISMSNTALASSGKFMIVMPGGVAVASDEASLASSAKILTPTPGGVSLAQDKMDLAGAAEAVSLAAITALAMSKADLASAAQPLDLSVRVVLAADRATLASAAQPLLTSAGAVSIQGDRVVLAGSAKLAQLVLRQALHLSLDALVGQWSREDGTTTDLYESINEVTPNDADYVRSELNPSSSPVVMKFEAGDDPALSTGHELSYRYQRLEGSQTINLTVELRQGYVDEGTPGTLIASWQHNDIGDSVVRADQALSEAEADSISDYADLFLRLVGDVA